MVMLMCKGGATMRSAGFVKNAAIYSICIVFAWWLSSFGKPLNGLTQWVMDTAYSTFGSGLSGSYEADADPVRFIALILMVLIYATVLFLLTRLVLRKFQAKR